jgi:hypothetical protein
LLNIPGRPELEKAYSMLLHREPVTPKEEDLALFAQWSRFDPRLAEIWVSFLIREWERYPPLELRNALLCQPWPATAAVLLEFTAKRVSNPTLFPFWHRMVTESFPKGNWEQFFIGLREIAGKAMQEDARFAFCEYRKWGYLGREILLNKSGRGSLTGGGKRTHTLLPETRQEILKEMLISSARITTDLYWEAISRCISRRQAERDLEKSSIVRACGKTRARYFLKR